MPNLSAAVRNIHLLEELACKRTIIHQLHPFVKLTITLLYLVLVISFDRYNLNGLLPFVFYPVIVLSLAEIPLLPLLKRMLIALPFSLFAGISNLIFDRQKILLFADFFVTTGVISFLSIMLKTALTVMAVLLLIATTSMTDLTEQLLRLRLPSVVVLQLTMTYRYISVLAEEAGTMMTAYLLRAPQEKAIKMMDMGNFAGQLLLRSFDRAERVYQAMRCRGFAGSYAAKVKRPFTKSDGFFLLIWTFFLLLFRFVPVVQLIGTL